MKCPACSFLMTETRRGLLLIDQCPNCRALWFDQSELERYARARRVYDDAPHATTGRPATVPAEPVPCPRCASQTLQPGTWRGITMAVCSQCDGVFLTADGLRAVRATFGRAIRPEFQDPNSDDGTWDLIDYLLAPDS